MRPHSSAARMYPYSPVPRRNFRSDQSQAYYERAAAGLDVNVVQAPPTLSATPNRSHLGSISSEQDAHSSQRLIYQRIQDRTDSMFNAHSIRPNTNSVSSVRGRPLSPGSVYSHMHASRTSATPIRDLFSPTSDSRITYKDSPIASRYGTNKSGFRRACGVFSHSILRSVAHKHALANAYTRSLLHHKMIQLSHAWTLGSSHA